MRKLFISVFIILAVIGLLVSPVAAAMVTLGGERKVNNQLVADNEIYEVDNNAMGDDLVLNYMAQRVKVVGQLKYVRQSGDSDGYQLIKVQSFEVVEE